MKSPIFALAAVSLTLGFAGAQEWTRFRGPDGSAVSDAKGIPAEISAQNIKWEVALPGTGHSSPVLWGDTLFLTATEAAGARSLIALDAKSGKEKWRNKHEFTTYPQHRFNDYASSTPCVDADRIYITWTSPDGVEVAAVDHSGATVWKKTLGKFYAKHGSAASPVLAGGRVLISSLGETGKSFIAGLDPATGEEKWRLDRESNDKGSYCTPVLRKAEDGAIETLFTSTAHGITALDPASGKIRWEHDAGFTERCVAAPVVAGDVVFAVAGSGSGGKQSAVVRIKDGKPQPAWEAPRKGLPYVPTSVVFKGLLFLLDDGGGITCVRASDGEVLWENDVIRPPYASPIIVGDKIYCCSKDGQLVVLEATDSYKPVSEYKFPDGIYATPAVAGGRLYIRTFSKLYCIGE